MPILVPTVPAPSGGDILPPNTGDYDLEACFINYKNECIQSETPAYWTASYFQVCFLFIALFLNVFVISLFVREIREFKKMVFYWLAFQLMATNVVYCVGQLINRDTITIFANASRFDTTYTTGIYKILHSISQCIINLYSQLLPFGIISLALHRFGIFVLKERRISERHFITAVTVVIYLVAIPMTVFLTTFGCFYHFEGHQDDIKETLRGTAIGVYNFKCNTTSFGSWIFEIEQVVIPCIDLLIYIIIIVHLVVTKGFRLSQKASYFLLIPPFSLFVIVEASSLTGTFILTTSMPINSALVAKRVINIVDMIAASLIPIIVFATNKEVRQVVPYFNKKRTIVPNLLFLPPSQNLGSLPRSSRRKSEFLSHASGVQQPSLH